MAQENHFCELNQRLPSNCVTEGTKKGTLFCISQNREKKIVQNSKYVGNLWEYKARYLVSILDHKNWLFSCFESFYYCWIKE